MKNKQNNGKGKIDAKVGEKGPTSKKEPLSERIMPRSMLVETPRGYYVPGEKLEEGAASVIYKGKMVVEKDGEIFAEKPVAIKVFRFDEILEGLEDEIRECARKAMRNRFITVAKLTYKLRHPNIVSLDDFGDDFGKEGSPYYVMEYLEGRDLERIIAQTGPVPWEQARMIMLQACKGLEYAHNYMERDVETGEEKKYPVVHRDIKPENIFVVTNSLGEQAVKILDFGIAKIVEATGNDPAQGGGTVLGTPSYMAPEQALGKAVDERTDIYGLGSTMYHALTGCTVFYGETVNEILTKLVTTEEKAVPLRERRPDLDIPEEAEGIVMKCLEKDPAKRYQSMKELRAAIADTL